MALGPKLREARERVGLTQVELAIELGISLRAYGYLESGRPDRSDDPGRIGARTVFALCQRLHPDLQPDDFVADSRLRFVGRLA